MTTFLASLLVFGLALLAMAIGVLLGGRRIKGSCGGLSSFTDANGKSVCEACASPAASCKRGREESPESQAAVEETS